MPDFGFIKQFLICIFLLPVFFSCVSLSRYNQSQSALSKSETDRNNEIAKRIILENDTTVYGLKIRSLQNDIQYLEHIGKSESAKLNSEKETQNQQLLEARSQINILKGKIAAYGEKAAMSGLYYDSLSKILRDSLKLLSDDKKIEISNNSHHVFIKLNDNEWFNRISPWYMSPSTQDICHYLGLILQKDSLLGIEIEHTGPELQKATKANDPGNELSNNGKSSLIRNYLMENYSIKVVNIRLSSIQIKNRGVSESYRIILRLRNFD